MESKIIIIKNCTKCPHYSESENNHYCFHEKFNKSFGKDIDKKDIKTFPKFCL